MRFAKVTNVLPISFELVNPNLVKLVLKSKADLKRLETAYQKKNMMELSKGPRTFTYQRWKNYEPKPPIPKSMQMYG